MPLRLTLLGLLIWLPSGTAQVFAQSTAVQAVAAASAHFDEAFNNGDFSTLESLLTPESAMVVLGEVMVGRDAVVEGNRALRAERPDVSMRSLPESIEIGPISWAVASERGTWVERWASNGEQVELRGSYHAIWRLTDGRWLREALMLIPLACQGSYCDR